MNKQFLLLFALAMMMALPQQMKAGVAINETNFPDDNFCQYVKDKCDRNKDSFLSDEEIAAYTSILLRGCITNLKGIEFLTALTYLDCRGIQLTSLDISKNTKLRYLGCSGNLLTSLDVSKNTELEELDCSNNQLTSFDVSKNTALTKLSCEGNQLALLDVSKNIALTSLFCGDNRLTTIDLSNNIALGWLSCSWNYLTSLDVSKNTALTHVYCEMNNIKSTAMDALIESLSGGGGSLYAIRPLENDEKNIINKAQVNAAKAKGWTIYYYNNGYYVYEGSDPVTTGIAIDEVNFPDENFRNWILSQNFGADGLLTDEEIATVTGISVEGKEISDLKGIEYFTALIWLACEGNKLTNLDISKNTALMALRCDENKLTSLDVSKNLAMTELTCGGNQLATLDVSNNTALWNLVCYNNQLAALDVSKNIALTQLLCNSNQLTSLDVTKNTALKLLWCYNNQLTSLDVSANTELTELLCYSNHLSSLDVSANEKLEKLWCDNNQLSSLDVSSNSKLHELYCFANLIKGDGMESLVASLPETTNGDLYAISHFYENEQNEVTKDQVAAAKKKGWTIYHVDMEQNKWVIYEGSDPVLPKITINANGGQVYYNKEEIDNTIETFDIEEGLNRLFFPTDTILKITVNGEDVTSQLTLMDAVITSVDEFGRTRDKRIADVPSLLITPTGQNLQVDIEFVGDRQVIQEDGILYVIDGSEAYVVGATDCPENLVLPSSVTNEGKSYKIIGLIPKCFSYWKELKSVSLPESLKYVTVGAFFVCENLENVEISSNVEYIGEFAFYYNKIKTIKVFAKDPIKCFGFDNDVFNSVLYVPKGCKTKYENADFWKYFKTIVEMGIVPVDEGQTIDIGNEITENTDLDGNVVGNIYYSISSGDGSYNPTEGCLVLTKPTNDLAINLYDIFSEYFKEQFNGLAFKLAPGKGSIKVEAETQGNMVLKVKIGNNDPIEMELDGKLKVKFPYNVSEETLVYIYGGMSTAGAKATGGTRASADADLLKIYGFEVVSDASGIDAIENGLPANADAPVYNLNGQRVDTPTKGIYIKNGRKVLVK